MEKLEFISSGERFYVIERNYSAENLSSDLEPQFG